MERVTLWPPLYSLHNNDEIKDGPKSRPVGPLMEHWCKLWAQTPERMALSQEMNQSYWAHPQPLRLRYSGSGLDLGNNEILPCSWCGPGVTPLMVMSCHGGGSSVGSATHTLPCTTFLMDYPPECSPPSRPNKEGDCQIVSKRINKNET